MDNSNNEQPSWQPTIFDLIPELDPDGIGLGEEVETIEPETVPTWNDWPDSYDEEDPTVRAIIDNQDADDSFYTTQDEYDETMAAIERQMQRRFGNKVKRQDKHSTFLPAKLRQAIGNGGRRAHSASPAGSIADGHAPFYIVPSIKQESRV